MNESKELAKEVTRVVLSTLARGEDNLAIYQAVETALRASAPQADGRALEPLAKLALWRDTYPDGPDKLTDYRLQGYFTPDQVRAARSALSAPPSVALEAREALEKARDFIDPDRDPPRMTNRELVALINAALTRPQPGGAVAGTERGEGK